MKQKNETFAQLLNGFGYHYDLRTVFEDFLTLSMCAVTQHPGKGKSHYEDLYLQRSLLTRIANYGICFPKPLPAS